MAVTYVSNGIIILQTPGIPSTSIMATTINNYIFLIIISFNLSHTPIDQPTISFNLVVTPPIASNFAPGNISFTGIYAYRVLNTSPITVSATSVIPQYIYGTYVNYSGINPLSLTINNTSGPVTPATTSLSTTPLIIGNNTYIDLFTGYAINAPYNVSANIVPSVNIAGNPTGVVRATGSTFITDVGQTYMDYDFQRIFDRTTGGTVPYDMTVNINGDYLFYTIGVDPIIICYTGESKILIYDKITNSIANKMVSDIDINNDLVFSTSKIVFEPIIKIIKSKTDRLRLIPKNSLADNLPTDDLRITGGHIIIHNGKECKARDIPGSKRIKAKSEIIYSLCLNERQPILINGIQVMAWGIHEWENSVLFHQQ